MKRKFILLSITLTALAPAIGLGGCNIGRGGDTPEPTPPKYITLNDPCKLIISGIENYGVKTKKPYSHIEKNTKYNLTIDMTKWEGGGNIDSFYFYIGSLNYENVIPLNPNSFDFFIGGEKLSISMEEEERIEFYEVYKIASAQTIEGYVTTGDWELIDENEDIYFIFYSLLD